MREHERGEQFHYLSVELPGIRHLWESPIESRAPSLSLSFYFPARMKDVRHHVNFTRQRYENLDIYILVISLNCDVS